MSLGTIQEEAPAFSTSSPQQIRETTLCLTMILVSATRTALLVTFVCSLHSSHAWKCTSSNKLASSYSPAIMAAATQLGMSASSFLCPTSITAKRVESAYSRSSTTLIVCQRADVSRRVFAVAGAAAAAATTLIRVPEAQARRKTPPPAEEKKVEPDDKNLSAYDARILANARRKEQMKATVEAAKAKAKSIAPSIAQTPPQ